MRRRRTYWHLESLGRRPSDYEVATTRLTFAPTPGSSVNMPMRAFYAAHGPGARFVAVDWERFADPLATTYAKYVERQRDREVVVQTLFDGLDASSYDKNLPPAWRARLGRTLSALRFPAHALQMLAAYLARMAPSSPVIIVFALQAADELRRVQRFAYRLRQLVDLDAGLPDAGRDDWQHDAAWQPLRRLVEELFVTWDWAAAFTAVSLLLKPVFDDLVLVRWAKAGADEGDAVLPLWTSSLHEDARWHGDVATRLARHIAAAHADNAVTLARLVEAWRPRVDAALAPLAASLIDAPAPTQRRDDALAALGLPGAGGAP